MKPRFFVASLFVVLFVCTAPSVMGAPPASAGSGGPGLRSESASPPALQARQPAGQRPVRYDEEIIVTADREAENIRNVGSSVSVISSGQIAASGARWLLDVLQFVPGVNVVRGGPAGSLAQVFVRGSNTGHTLFLIDGVKVNSPTSGAYDVSGIQLAAEQIDRIEVVRGPQSTLYGSQAIGGVINVITRRGSGAGTWGVEADGGAYSSGRFHTWGTGQAGSVRLIGGISYFDSAGFSTASSANGNIEADGYRNLSYNGRLDYTSDRGVVARGYVRGFDGDLDFDGFDFSEGPVDNLLNVQTSAETIVGGAVGYLGEGVSSIVEVSTSDADLTTDTPGDFFTGFALDSSIREVDWQNELVVPGAQTLVGGVEYRREQAATVSTNIFGSDSFDEKVDVIGVYVQDRVRIADRARITGGVRFEDHSTFGSKWTGRLTATVDATDVVRVHGSAGSGFKAPTLNDLYFPGFSNPDLQPEESVGFDIGVETFMPAPHVRFDVTLFYNDITDLIEFDFVSGRPENIGNVTTTGAEIGGDYAASESLSIAGAYTFTDATPVASEEQLIRRPRHQASIRLTVHPVEDLRLWSEVRVKGESFDNGVGGREALDGFTLVNLAADYQVLGMLLIRGRVDNLFDTDHEEILGFGTTGLSVYLGVTLTLSR